MGKIGKQQGMFHKSKRKDEITSNVKRQDIFTSTDKYFVPGQNMQRCA